MASNITNKIGCQSGGLKIVDPNSFDGFNSSSNISVPLEDLTISVVLRTKKKGRTVLTKEGGSDGTRESTSNISINFIEGSEISGNKVLTTKFTELTTVFDKDTTNDETLGITSIDIDFNSSMAPMVTVNFIDVRGSSIFQNEEKISGNNSGNKYATFFQLPYPLFELEIKGYYGLPVTYCLHMLKFSSKFNSKTGNFEIQCQFIGYTYAMLSDMLIGYLKAIPFTTIGEEKYKKYRENRTADAPQLLTLVELMQAISKVNKGISKLSSSSKNAAATNTINKALESLDAIEIVMRVLGQVIDIDTSKEKYPYIVKLHEVSDTDKINQDRAIGLYSENIKKNIDTFNALKAGGQLVVKEFQDISIAGPGKGFYGNLTLEMLDPATSDPAVDEVLKQTLGSPSDFSKFKKELYDYLNTNYKFNHPKVVVDIYNMNLLFDKIAVVRTQIEQNSKAAKEAFAKELKTSVAKDLGFEPTVRNITEVFTAAVEVFMETIFDVSVAAEVEPNDPRTTQLEKKFKTDIVNSDLTQRHLDSKKYFSWPDYREKDEKTKTYVEKYLGTLGVLDKPTDVNELVFIDNLLAAFLKAAKASEDVKADAEKEETTWFPSNPIDTSIFNTTEPYSRMEFKNYDEVIRLMVIRGMTFLGYTNDETIMSADDVISMAEIESEAILRGVKDPQIKSALSMLTLSAATSVIGEINLNERGALPTNVIKPLGDSYFYNYIGGNPVSTKTKTYTYSNADIHTVIPINGGYTGKWTIEPAKTSLKSKEDGYIFLTNYSSNYGTATTINGDFSKPDDGGVYIKILKADEFKTKALLYPAPAKVKPENNMLILEKLAADNVDASAGYNTFGGPLGIQEYANLDYGNGMTKLPLEFVFYKNTDGGLAYNRKTHDKSPDGTSATSWSDFKKTGNIRLPANKEEFYKGYYKGKKIDTLHVDLGKNRDFFNEWINNNVKDITYPYVEQRAFMFKISENDNYRDAYDEDSFSLFGSYFYYNQGYARITTSNNSTVPCGDYSKAFLFLNSLPWNTEKGSPLEKNEIKHLFDKKGGFIHAPRLWCAYIGSIIWRQQKNNPVVENGKITGGGSGKNDPILWSKNTTQTFTPPTRDMYVTALELTAFIDYQEIDDEHLINRLPQQVKNEFKRMFFQFVNGTDGMISWKSISENLEIWKGSGVEFNTWLTALRATITLDTDKDVYNVPASSFTNPNFRNGSNGKAYKIITPFPTTDGSKASVHTNYLALELDGDYTNNSAVTILMSALMQPVIIANTGYKIWKNVGTTTTQVGTYGGSGAIGGGGSAPVVTTNRNEFEEISVTKKNFDLYVNTILKKLQTTASAYSETNVKKQLEQSLFGTADEDVIKLQLYRTCKNIRDKWLAGTTSADKILYQCGGVDGGRSNVDTKLGDHYGNKTPKFIDSFRFVSRSFKDIGDKLYINPLPINDYLVENSNTSAYDAISSMLASNKFDFVALPTFINFRDPKEVESIFKPYANYGEAITKGSCGPTFVCVYSGQKSKHLDYKNADYPDDGINLRCDENGNVNPSTVPDDFTTDLNDFEDGMGVFTVKYSQQNQNIFKDINLDQSEFSETDESLQIQEDISQKGSETNRTIAGQNIYNVYSVRSYTAEVEMMGNAMIQPMMYFQLDNIPMFHGAYMITRVKHSIKPNSMMTNFTGVRIKFTETPLMTAMDLYMSLAEGIDTTQAGDGAVTNVSSTKAYPPIVLTIIDNGGSPSNIEAKNIKMLPIPTIAGISNQLTSNADKHKNRLIAEAIVPLENMLKDWVTWMKANGFKGTDNGKTFARITSAFRTEADQAAAGSNASKGVSNHQWGIAIDLGYFEKDGTKIENTNGLVKYFDIANNPALEWLLENSYRYGFELPYLMRDGVGSYNEYWHFEYQGTAAQFCAKDNPSSTGGYKIKKFQAQFDFVKNPKSSDGKDSVYKDCIYKQVKYKDGVEIVLGSKADYWSLMAICSLEAGGPQSRADVAQSIYNRVSVPKQPYGKTIKEVVVQEGQYEPTFKNRPEWKAIADEQTAIKAVMNSKSITNAKAKTFLTETIAALKDTTLQENSRSFIGTRTEFLAYNPKSSKAVGVVSRTPDKTNNNFYWEYAGKQIKDGTPPNPPNLSSFA